MELNLQPPSLRVTDDFRNPHFRLKLIDSETDVLVCLKHFRELCSKLLNRLIMIFMPVIKIHNGNNKPPKRLPHSFVTSVQFKYVF